MPRYEREFGEDPAHRLIFLMIVFHILRREDTFFLIHRSLVAELRI